MVTWETPGQSQAWFLWLWDPLLCAVITANGDKEGAEGLPSGLMIWGKIISPGSSLAGVVGSNSGSLERSRPGEVKKVVLGDPVWELHGCLCQQSCILRSVGRRLHPGLVGKVPWRR